MYLRAFTLPSVLFRLNGLMSTDNKVEYVLLISCNDRPHLTDHLTDAGFKWIESTGTRSIFQDGDFAAFRKSVTSWMRQNPKSDVYRVLRIEDPGFGLFLDFAEDLGAREGCPPLSITDSWEPRPYPMPDSSE